MVGLKQLLFKCGSTTPLCLLSLDLTSMTRSKGFNSSFWKITSPCSLQYARRNTKDLGYTTGKNGIILFYIARGYQSVMIIRYSFFSWLPTPEWIGNRLWNTVLRKFGSYIMDIKCFVSKCKYTSSWLDIYYGICLSRTPRSDFIKYSIVHRWKNDSNKGCSRCSRAMSMTRRGILSARPSTTACGIPDSKVHGAHMGPNWGR